MIKLRPSWVPPSAAHSLSNRRLWWELRVSSGGRLGTDGYLAISEAGTTKILLLSDMLRPVL